jgi:hypothetical protein
MNSRVQDVGKSTIVGNSNGCARVGFFGGRRQ